MLDWSSLLSALGLVLIIEGLLLFVSPDGMKQVWLEAIRLASKKLRFVGLGAIMAGVVLLYIIR